MEDIKLNVRALAAMQKISIEELAKQCDIDPSHLKSVSSGRVTMSAEDLLKLSAKTGIPPQNIEY